MQGSDEYRRMLVHDYRNHKRRIYMSDEAVQAVEAVANEVVPDSIAAKAAGAVVETIANPNPIQILEDIKIAVELVNEFRAKIKDHPTLSDYIKALF